MTAPAPGSTVYVNNGGTYDGRAVQVLDVETSGALIVTHPTHPRNRLRLQPARTVNGLELQAQYRASATV